METNNLELIRTIKNFVSFCAENNHMPKASQTNTHGLQLLFYTPYQLLDKSYKKLGLDKDKLCFVVVDQPNLDSVIFKSQEISKDLAFSIFETLSDYLFEKHFKS